MRYEHCMYTEECISNIIYASRVSMQHRSTARRVQCSHAHRRTVPFARRWKKGGGGVIVERSGNIGSKWSVGLKEHHVGRLLVVHRVGPRARMQHARLGRRASAGGGLGSDGMLELERHTSGALQ
jgi:hypothetical protein